MNIKKALLSLIIAGACSLSAPAVTIDFASFPEETTITDQFASDGVTFATEDADGNLGAPATLNQDVWGSASAGLSNTPTGDYPTTEFLNIDFTTPATDITFVYDNINTDPHQTSTYIAYDSNHNVLDTGNITSLQGSPVTVNASGVSLLQISNGESQTGDGFNWIFSVYSLDFAPVPEPSQYGAFIFLGVLGFFGWRKFSRSHLLAEG